MGTKMELHSHIEYSRHVLSARCHTFTHVYALLLVGALALLFLSSIASAGGTKQFVLVADTHYGNVIEGNGSADDIDLMEKWINNTDPDFLLHMGDVASYEQKKDIAYNGSYNEFIQAGESFDELINETPIEDVWWVVGNHDAYADIDNQNNSWAHWDGARFLRDRHFTSPWYTIREGNNVFIFCAVINDMKFGWDSDWRNMSWGEERGSSYIPQNKLDWLEGELGHWENTENNIFLIVHLPITDTNGYSRAWHRQTDNQWLVTSKKLLELLEEYRVDVYMHGHVHTDPDTSKSSDVNVSRGTVLVSGFRTDLPNTTFLRVSDINWEHAKEATRSSYPSLMYFNLTDGSDHFDLRAVRLDKGSETKITVNNSATGEEYVRIPLSYNVTGMEGNDNHIDDYRQGWGVWEYSDEGTCQWYKDSEGLRVNKSVWIESRWDMWKVKTVTEFTVNWTSTRGSMNHTFYASNNAMVSWSGPYSDPTDMPTARWFRVNTTITPNTNEIVYVYDMQFEAVENDITPPFLSVEYDPITDKVLFIARDSGGQMTTLRVRKSGSYRTYTLTDIAGNTAQVKLLYGESTVRGWTVRKFLLQEAIFNGNHVVKFTNGEKYALRTRKVSGDVRDLVQKIGGAEWTYKATYSAGKDRTRVLINDGGWSSYFQPGCCVANATISMKGFQYSLM